MCCTGIVTGECNMKKKQEMDLFSRDVQCCLRIGNFSIETHWLFCDNLKYVTNIMILISESDYSINYQVVTIPLQIQEFHVTHD